jgi:diacylglycerol kinase (ATP)
MSYVKQKGIRRIIAAFGYSLAGLRAAFIGEAAFRQELALAALLIPLACVLEVGNLERALMVASVILVLIVELMNTAIETLVERISPEIHPLSKKAKDIGSAAVLMTLLLLGVVWGWVLLG